MIALDRFTAKTSLVIKISSLRMRIEKVPYEACISPEMPRIYFKISICIDRCIFNITYYLSSNIFLINKVLIFSMYHQMYIYFIMQNILPKNRKKGSLFFSILLRVCVLVRGSVCSLVAIVFDIESFFFCHERPFPIHTFSYKKQNYDLSLEFLKFSAYLSLIFYLAPNLVWERGIVVPV